MRALFHNVYGRIKIVWSRKSSFECLYIYMGAFITNGIYFTRDIVVFCMTSITDNYVCTCWRSCPV